LTGALPTLAESATEPAAQDPAGAAADADSAAPLAGSPAAAQAASAAAAFAQAAASTQSAPASTDTPGAVPTRPASNPTIAAPNRIEAATGNANTQGTAGSSSGGSPPIGGSLQSSLAAALEIAQAIVSDTAASSASKLQAAADSAPAATAAQNPALQGIAGTIETSSAVTVSAAMPAIADAAALALAGLGDKHAHENGADLGGNANGDGNSDAGAAAQQLGSNTPSAPSDAGATPTLKVNAALDSASFPQGLAERVTWVVDNNLNGAKLQVNPPQLGPIELQIAVQGDHAQVWMSTHSAVTRDALESSVPKLREMLGAQGFGDVRVDISQRSFQERSAYAPPYEWVPPSDRAEPSTAAASSTAARISLGAVDAYA
jgi:flagellar hook-length control protein FliK